MHFSQFARRCVDLANTASRLAKINLAADLLKQLAGDEIRSGVAFLSGRIFPVSDPRALDLGPAAFAQAREIAVEDTSQDRAPTLSEVAEAFGRIAGASGKGSRLEKSIQLRALVERIQPADRRILFRLLHGELRIGVHDGLILEAIARASGADLKSVRRAALFLSDLAEVAVIALTGGAGALQHVDIKLFVPLLPMLSELAEDLREVLRIHGGQTALEYKYDGARVQIHKQADQVRIWSRRLTEVTASLPEIVDLTRRLDAESLILDGEVVAVANDGRPYPFQELMRRFRRVHGIEAASSDIPLKLFLFDCLLVNGASLIDESYEARWQRLTELTRASYQAARMLVSDAAEAEHFLRAALAAGHEGIMAKALQSTYMPGNRGKLWFKIKPAETIDCVIIAADRGSGRRRAWLSNYHLAVANGNEDFAPVGKTFKGLTDEQFTEMTDRLQLLQLADDGYTVAVRPEVVVEVAYNEIQRSPQYSSGFALRFARIKRIRADKGAAQITTLGELRVLYEKQFAVKSRREP